MLSNGMNVALDDQEKTLSMLTVLAKLWICIPKDGSDTGGFDLIIFFSVADDWEDSLTCFQSLCL